MPVEVKKKGMNTGKEVFMKVAQILVGRMAVFSYLVACLETKEALIIDPGGNEEELSAKIKQADLKLKYIFPKLF